MSYDLYITFSGLCLFAYDDAAGSEQVHVLFPRTGDSPRDCGGQPSRVHEHHAWLVFDKKYAPTPSTGTTSVRIEGTRLQFGNGTASGPNPQLGRPVGDLTKRANVRVKRQFTEGELNGEVITRATLTAGLARRWGRGAIWKLGTEERQELTHLLQWHIPDNPGDTFTVITPGGPQTLRAVDEKIELELHHIPHDESPVLTRPELLYEEDHPTRDEPCLPVEGDQPHPHPPGDGEDDDSAHHGGPPPFDAPPLHFHAFFRLCDVSTSSERCPRFRCGPPSAVGTKGVSPYTCMVIGGAIA